MRTLFKFLASLKLALLLLAVIIFASAWGTIFESKFNADVARTYIYNAAWFNAWMVLLCVNLFCAAAIRYPWKPHQTGFVITHAGIITMLIGGMIDRQWGIEGFMALTRGEPPSDIMELHEQEVKVYEAGKPEPIAQQNLNLKVLLAAAPQERTFALPTQSSDVRVIVKDVANVEPYRTVVPDSEGKPALQVVLRGAMMGVHEQWVVEGEHINMGPAAILFEAGDPPTPEADKLVPRMERHFVFAKHSEGINRTVYGEPTGAKPKLVMKDNEPELHFSMQGKDFVIPVKPNIKNSYPLPGIDGWRLFIVDYFPNFRMMGDKPGNLNDNPDNPAIMLELNGPLVKQGERPEEEQAGDDPHNPHGGGSSRKRNALEFYLTADGKLHYVIKSRKHAEKHGEVPLEKAVSLPWAPGTEFVVNQLEKSAKTKIAYRPLAVVPTNAMGGPGGTPGMLIQVAVGNQSAEQWIGQKRLDLGYKRPEGDDGPIVVEPLRDKIEVGGKTIEVALNSRWVRLPFKVALLKFHAPMDEGENSTTFMAFESTLSFDNKADSVTLRADAKTLQDLEIKPSGSTGTMTLSGAITDIGETGLTFELPDRRSARIPFSEMVQYDKQTHKIYMNSPTIFPEVWYAPWLGTSYKFSQAGHDMPANPDYSGVQVLRDPGWFFKWVGSLGICFGIFTMFYLKPYFNRQPAPTAAPAKLDRKDAKVDGKIAATVAHSK